MIDGGSVINERGTRCAAVIIEVGPNGPVAKKQRGKKRKRRLTAAEIAARKNSRRSPIPIALRRELFTHRQSNVRQVGQPPEHEARIAELQRRVWLKLPTDCGPLPGDEDYSLE